MSDQEQMVESHEGGITTLTLNRPEARNAMTGEMIQSLLEALPRLAQDSQVRCIVLTGAGGAFVRVVMSKGSPLALLAVVCRPAKKSALQVFAVALKSPNCCMK